tara:strand:+ start:1811 stop:2440 length:630 start_codon:yes stop_codon:yes gene_type:complete
MPKKPQLKPEKVSPYLPHSLKVIMEGKKTNVAWISTKNIAVIRPDGVGEYKRIRWKYAHLNILLILKPLIDLNEQAEDGLSHLEVIDRDIFNSTMVDDDNSYSKMWYQIVNGYEKMNIYQANKLIDYLYKNHFDVEAIFNHGKGLIEQKLAIDINDINGKLCDGCRVRTPHEHRCHGKNCTCQDLSCRVMQGKITSTEAGKIAREELDK